MADETPKDDNPDITQVRPAWMWIRDAKGFGSVTVTLVFVSFLLTSLAYVLSIFETIGSVNIRQFDVAACSTYFIPILTTYTARKYTDAKFKS